MDISLYERCGPNCITSVDGQALYDEIHPELKAGRPVRLDFTGVQVVASPFMNAGIGQLLEDVSARDLNRLLTMENLTPTGANVLRLVIENAKDYYSSPTRREAIDRVLDDEALLA